MISVSPAAVADVEEAAVVLAAAFRHDPPTLALLGGDEDSVQERATELFTAMLRSGPVRDGTVDLARDDAPGHRIAGVAIWHAPGAHGGGVLDYLKQVPAFLRAFGLGGIPRALDAARAVAAHRPATPHWYLQAVGVDGAFRGQGVGRVLLENGLARADRASLPAYLESSTQRTGALYRTLGFRAVTRVQGFPGPAPMAMWRQVATA